MWAADQSALTIGESIIVDSSPIGEIIRVLDPREDIACEDR
jgi:hypothetical protein